MVFDVTNRRSFVDLHVWLDDLKQWAEENVQIILVGNKGESQAREYIKKVLIHVCMRVVDCPAESREVTSEDAQAWADEHSMEYMETSAKTGQNIEATFETTAKKIHERLLLNKEEMAKKKRKQSGSFPSLQLGGQGSKAGGCC